MSWFLSPITMLTKILKKSYVSCFKISNLFGLQLKFSKPALWGVQLGWLKAKVHYITSFKSKYYYSCQVRILQGSFFFTMSQGLSPAAKDHHQLQWDPDLTYFQMQQIPNTQTALIQHSCLSYAPKLWKIVFPFFHRQHRRRRCQPDSTKETQSPFLPCLLIQRIYVLS